MERTHTSELLADLGWIQALARRLADDPQLADDLTQDTVLAALTHDTALARPRAWLATVLRNLFRQHLRGERARGAREAAAARTGPGDAAAELVQRAELQQELVAAVLALPAEARDVVLLRFFDGLPPRTIAARLGAPVATIHSRLQRALHALRDQLDRRPGGRATWVAALAPILNTPLTPAPVLGTLLMNKLQVLAVLALTAGAVTWFWTTTDSGSKPAAAGPRVAGERGEAAPPGGSAAADPGVRRIPVPAPAGTSQPAASRPPQVHIRGRVLDCSATPVAGVRVTVRDGALDDHAVSDAAGGFDLVTMPESVELVAGEERFVTVLAGSWSPQARFEPVLVVAPVLSLAGQIVDAAQAPVAGALLLLQLPADFHTRFSLPLDRTQSLRWNEKAKADGAFRMARVPRIAGSALQVTADTYRPALVPAPAADDLQMRITLTTFHFEEGRLAGVVVDPAGAAVAGARVSMGVTTVVSDKEGRFELSLRRAGWPTALTAAKAGYLPGRRELPRTGGTKAEEWPERIVLQLGPRPLSIRGRVVDQDGSPIAGALVWVADPTLLGIAGLLPLQLEYLLAGGEVPAQAARMRVPYADRPTEGDHFTDMVSTPEQPTASWYFVTSGAQGEFEVPGLLPRDYKLRALDPKTAISAETEPVPAGGATTVRIAREHVWPRLQGRVVSLRGQPLADVEVVQVAQAFHSNERVPGGRFDGRAVRHGQRARTDAEGRFTLKDVGQQHTSLVISGDAILPKELLAAAVTDPAAVRIEVEARCHVEVDLLEPAEANRISVRDGAGQPLDIGRITAGSNSFETDIPLHDGKSGMFVVSERAAKLLLQRGETVVREVPITPDPGRVTRVR